MKPEALMRVMLSAIATTLLSSMPAAAADTARSVTFTKDVAPILQEKCQACHAPGQMAPMPLRTYDEVRPWVRSMKLKVSKREMPPWFIDRTIGIQNYKNDISLSDEQIDTIVRWVDAGAPQGNPADMPAPKPAADNDGWTIGKPDLIVTMDKPFKMYAQGSDWWANFTMPTGLTEDRWIKAVQWKPGNRKVVHHFSTSRQAPDEACGDARSLACLTPQGAANVGVGPDGPPDRYAQEEKEAEAEERKQGGEGGRGAEGNVANAGGSGSLGIYLPGFERLVYGDDTAVLMKKGSTVTFAMHYSASGEDATDQSSMGFVFYPKGYTPKQVYRQAYFQKFPAFELDIPPNSRPTHDAYMRMDKPFKLIGFQPHMHARGLALTLEAILPTGRVMTISAVENYNFYWQVQYNYADDEAPLLPAGTTLHAISTFDNTAANPRNPDPNKWVGYGQASNEEMAGTFVTYVTLERDEYLKMASERRAKQRQQQTQKQTPQTAAQQ